jgi:hypothetical protein
MMNHDNGSRHRRKLRRTCAVLGAGAFATLAVLGVALGTHPAPESTYQANSGDAPTNTTYVHPSIPAMTMGATATFTPPDPEPATSMAAPVVKATPYSGG